MKGAPQSTQEMVLSVYIEKTPWSIYDRGEIAGTATPERRAVSAMVEGWETFTGSGTSGGFGGAVSPMGPRGLEMGRNLLEIEIHEPFVDPGDRPRKTTGLRALYGIPRK